MPKNQSGAFDATGNDVAYRLDLRRIKVPRPRSRRAALAYRFRFGARALLVAVLLQGVVGVAYAEKLPPLWGYGIKPCDQYLRAAEGEAQGVDLLVWEYRRYEDWLTGFISGLNLSTGKDVLQGADIDSAMRRIRAWCGGHEKEDFFTATMDFVRMLSALR